MLPLQVQTWSEAKRLVRRTYPHVVPLHVESTDHRDAIHAWCGDLCQSPSGVEFSLDRESLHLYLARPWCHFYAMFWFRDPDHAFAFKMRWFRGT